MNKYHISNLPNPDKTHWDRENREWYEERNKELIADKQEKTYRELVLMYGLSTGRLQQLIKNQYKKLKEINERNI